jgi:hypothetical protein
MPWTLLRRSWDYRARLSSTVPKKTLNVPDSDYMFLFQKTSIIPPPKKNTFRSARRCISSSHLKPGFDIVKFWNNLYSLSSSLFFKIYSTNGFRRSSSFRLNEHLHFCRLWFILTLIAWL